MRDSEVVAAIVAGDPAGLAAAYDRYAAALYNYSRSMLREPADAADAVQDTFIIAASQVSGLRDPERLRSWLYAVARNECRRRLRTGSELALLEEAADAADVAADVSADAERADLRALVRDAMAGLGPAERDVLELQLRQGLSGGEVACVLGISRNHAHALMSRARDQVQTALGVLIVARGGRQDCPGLDALLEGWDGALTVLLRKRVNRHIEGCPVCSERRRRETAPAALLGLAPIAALPLATAIPLGLRHQVLRAAAGNSPAAVAHRAAVAHTAYPFGHHGFPRPLDPPRTQLWPPRPVHVGAVAGTATAVTLAVTVIATPPRHVTGSAGGGTADVTAGTSPVAGRVDRTAGRKASETVHPSAPGRQPPASATVSQALASPSGLSSLPGSLPGSSSPSASSAASPSASGPATTAVAPGTLSVSPATIDIVPPATGTITLTASGGPVSWSIWEPPGLDGKVVVSPASGTLAADATITVSVTVTGPGKMHVHLVVSPGGMTVTVVIG